MSTLDIDESLDVHGLHGRVKLRKAERVVGESGAWMDMERRKLQAYEYLCHVGEAREWMEAVVKEPLPPIESLEDSLRNGIIFAKLSKAFDPSLASRKIYEASPTKLVFKHSDNINMLFTAMQHVGLPDLFVFELTDLYDKKNIPKVIYCIHALAHLLAKKGLAPRLKDLLGKLSFTDEQLDKTNEDLEAAAVPMPAFGNIQNALAKELDEPSEQDKRDKYLKDHEREIILAQAQWRGHSERKAYQSKIGRFKSHEELWTKLQARYRGKKNRKNYLDRVRHWRNSEESIVKIQAIWRAKQAEKAYKALCSQKNADMKILQNFLSLLEDEDYDFEEDHDLEHLRQLVITRIRECIATESDVNNLDLKIALLVKNRISLEEVIHFSTKQMKTILSSSESISDKDVGNFNLKGGDKENRQRKLHYEQLFYLLQTQPQYLTKLMYLMNQKSGASVTRFLEQTVLTLFGYAQNTREEYLLLNLIDSAIKLEISYLSKLEDFWRDNPLFIKLVLQYIRGAKERLYLRELLQPLVKSVLKDKSLHLDLDAPSIYKKLIKQEESATGEKSSKPHDVTPAEASADPDVKTAQLENVKKLKELTEEFLNAIAGSTKSMPYGIRYIAQKMTEHMQRKFPGSEEEINKIVGNLVYYRYINPAIVAPEAFDVIESNISATQRKNLAEVAKTLHQVSIGKSVSGTEPHLIELNACLQNASKRFATYLNEVKSVPTAEEYFDMNEFVDSGRQSKPRIYISPEEVIQVHRNFELYLEELDVKTDDPLRTVLTELGPAPPSAYSGNTASSEVTLELKDRFAKVDDASAKQVRKLFNETKRFVIAVLHTQIGSNLLDTLEARVTLKEESAFTDYTEKELERARERAEYQNLNAKSNNSLSDSKDISPVSATSPQSVDTLHLGTTVNTLFVNPDGSKMTFAQLKRKTLENMAKLEEFGQVSKENKYQDMLNSLMEDIVSKHRRRTRRKKEVDTLRKTLGSVEEKLKYLNDQRQSYHDYIQGCMSQLGKKTKQRRVMPFTRQYFHIKELSKQGKMPAFGSYKFSAAELHKKGVLITIDEYEPRQYGQITLTISSEELGIFIIESSFLGIKLPEKMELRLEDLLTAQDNNETVITLFDSARVNLNLLIFLLNKKFFA